MPIWLMIMESARGVILGHVNDRMRFWGRGGRKEREPTSKTGLLGG